MSLTSRHQLGSRWSSIHPSMRNGRGPMTCTSIDRLSMTATCRAADSLNCSSEIAIPPANGAARPLPNCIRDVLRGVFDPSMCTSAWAMPRGDDTCEWTSSTLVFPYISALRYASASCALTAQFDRLTARRGRQEAEDGLGRRHAPAAVMQRRRTGTDGIDHFAGLGGPRAGRAGPAAFTAPVRAVHVKSVG